jgi:NAD(P)-dependent dehydrogenase (short-subunit alcohol dehydrogenase family)
VARVLIIGASRGIGLETVKAALEAGYSVRALARSAGRIPVSHPKLEKMAGDALEVAPVKRALTGVDAVAQSLGVSAGREIIFESRLFSKATQVLVTAMQSVPISAITPLLVQLSTVRPLPAPVTMAQATALGRLRLWPVLWLWHRL